MTPLEVTSRQLRAFLSDTGWNELPDVGPAGDTWVRPDDDDAPAILVPSDPTDRDYEALLDSAMRRLSWTTGLELPELVNRIVEATTDILEVSVIDPTTVAGRIGLDRGAALTQALRAVVMNGARLQFAGAKIVHSGGLSEVARRVVDQLELAPPSPGSFRLEVYAPLQQLQLGDDNELAMFAGGPRDAAHETLASALRAVDAVRITTDQELPAEADALEEAVSQGVSTNIVRAFQQLDTQSPALKVVFRGRWTKPDASTPESVTLAPHNFAKLPRLETMLRAYEPRERYSLRGWIKEAAADALALDLPLAGSVVVETREGNRMLNVHLELTGKQLQAAASGIGSTYLSATGTLERVGRDWYLTDPRDIRIESAS
jgi:hypothetical protein